MTWQQFSIPGKFPIKAVESLEEYPERWHFLFEPQLLVRVERDPSLRLSKPDSAVWGDIAKSSPSGANGREFEGEQGFWGEQGWQVNADFLHANSKLVKFMLTRNMNTFRWQRKCVHLLCNQFGMNRWTECVFYIKSAFRALYLGLRGL